MATTKTRIAAAVYTRQVFIHPASHTNENCNRSPHLRAAMVLDLVRTRCVYYCMLHKSTTRRLFATCNDGESNSIDKNHDWKFSTGVSLGCAFSATRKKHTLRKKNYLRPVSDVIRSIYQSINQSIDRRNLSTPLHVSVKMSLQLVGTRQWTLQKATTAKMMRDTACISTINTTTSLLS